MIRLLRLPSAKFLFLAITIGFLLVVSSDATARPGEKCEYIYQRVCKGVVVQKVKSWVHCWTTPVCKNKLELRTRKKKVCKDVDGEQVCKWVKEKYVVKKKVCEQVKKCKTYKKKVPVTEKQCNKVRKKVCKKR